MKNPGLKVSLILVICLAACAPVKREVIGNTLSSNRPNVTIKVSDEFDYDGSETRQQDYQHILQPLGRTSHIKHYLYTFIRKKPVPSGLFIVLSESDGVVYFGSPSKTSSSLEDWEYAYGFSKAYPALLQDTYLEFGDQTDPTDGQTCYMVNITTQYSGPDHNLRTEIIYKEALQFADLEDLQCQSWQPRLSQLNQTQQEYLAKFAARAAESFHLSN